MRSFDELLELGVYEVDSIDDHGEPYYILNVENALKYEPELYYAEVNAIETALLEAVDAGELEWDFDPDDLTESWVPTNGTQSQG